MTVGTPRMIVKEEERNEGREENEKVLGKRNVKMEEDEDKARSIVKLSNSAKQCDARENQTQHE